MLNYLPKLINNYLASRQAAFYSRSQKMFAEDLSYTMALEKFQNRNASYAYMHHYFHHYCPTIVRQHRVFYKQNHRGFGEDAFHAMWFTLLREFRPTLCLEIGVYRGQVVSLWALLAREFDFPCDIHGISPFTPAGDKVSKYLHDIDYLEDSLSNHRHFNLRLPAFLRAYSTDTAATKYIDGARWNLIYIDGNHEYEVALADYERACSNLADGGILVMDDSSLYTEYNPPRFAFAGHPGPSRIVRDKAMKQLRFIGGVGHNNVFIKQ
jgi:hypothetical protein